MLVFGDLMEEELGMMNGAITVDDRTDGAQKLVAGSVREVLGEFGAGILGRTCENKGKRREPYRGTPLPEVTSLTYLSVCSTTKKGTTKIIKQITNQ